MLMLIAQASNILCRRVAAVVNTISIHLMLMLIGTYMVDSGEIKNFNTSHVNVNHNIRGLLLYFQEFQYISC